MHSRSILDRRTLRYTLSGADAEPLVIHYYDETFYSLGIAATASGRTG
jgi:hypothetical protein